MILRTWLDEEGDTRALALLRIGLGGLLVLQAARQWQELRSDGFFGAQFHWAWLPEAWLPSAGVYSAVVILAAALAALAVAGVAARPALGGAALLSLYILLCDRLQFHHNRYALTLFAGLTALTPCDRVLTLGRGGPAVGPQWARRLVQLQLSLIYLASGGSKLLDADWRNGAVVSSRLHFFAGNAIALGVPRWLDDWLAGPAAPWLSKAAIAGELWLAVGMWTPLRAWALWFGLMFHLSIEITSRVELFSYLTAVVYLAFVTPAVRTRRLRYDPTVAGQRRVAAMVRALDWLARFEVEAAAGPLSVVVEGRSATGVAAWAEIARALPLTFPIWPALALARGARRRADQRVEE